MRATHRKQGARAEGRAARGRGWLPATTRGSKVLGCGHPGRRWRRAAGGWQRLGSREGCCGGARCVAGSGRSGGQSSGGHEAALGSVGEARATATACRRREQQEPVGRRRTAAIEAMAAGAREKAGAGDARPRAEEGTWGSGAAWKAGRRHGGGSAGGGDALSGRREARWRRDGRGGVRRLRVRAVRGHRSLPRMRAGDAGWRRWSGSVREARG